jgi:hypothetical protein
MRRVSIAFLLCTATALGQPSLKGIVDLHVHTNPDSAPPRRTDIFEIANGFEKEGFRAYVIKSHYEPTSQLAYAVNKIIPGVTAYGGIVLNRSVGGINPKAVEHFAMVTGNYARIVWMPTQDSENVVRHSPPPVRPFVPVSKNGALLPEVIEVLKVIKKYNLTLATGHSTAEECLMLVRAARSLGIGRIIVTHALPPPINMTVDQMKQAAAMGASIEFVYNLIYPDPEHVKRAKGRHLLDFNDYVQTIHAVGAEHCFLSSDVGQPNRPLQAEAWREYLAALMQAGLTVSEIDIMTKRNPARLIGLE